MVSRREVSRDISVAYEACQLAGSGGFDSCRSIVALACTHTAIIIQQVHINIAFYARG